MTAPISGRLRAALRLLKTAHTRKLTALDIREAYVEGLTKDQIRDVLYVKYLFDVYNRLADTLGWEKLDREGYRAAGKMLGRFGYGMSG